MTDSGPLRLLLVPILSDGDSGEPLATAYQLWWGPRVALTRSQHMVMKQTVRLFQEGSLSLGEAQLLESGFCVSGWNWVDRASSPTKQRNRLGEIMDAVKLNE